VSDSDYFSEGKKFFSHLLQLGINGIFKMALQTLHRLLAPVGSVAKE